MPSRKKAQGKARKAARADKAKEAASVPPKDFTERLRNEIRKGLPLELCRMFGIGNEQLLKNASTSNDLVGQCVQQGKPFVAAIDDMEEKYPGIFESPSKLKWAISFYHSRRTQDVIDGNMKRAHHAAICATLMNGYLSDVSDLSTMKLDIMQANDKMIVTYFRKRTSCSCLDEKRKEYKGVKKTGKCCNDQCPLPERVAERSSLLYCTACKLVQYCSAECQKAHWKYHKHQCTSIAKLNSIDYEYVQKIAQTDLLL
eukprot:scaffold514_cov121-Skeletonema_marinoi.AAC.3